MALKFSILNRQIKSNKVSTKLMPYAKAKHIGLVINDPLNNAASPFLDAFIKQLRNDGKAVEKIIIHKKLKPDTSDQSANHFNQKMVDNKDVGALGLPKTAEFKEILNESYDYLIFCNPIKNFKNICLAGLSKSHCKIGPVSFGEKYLDLLIQEEENNEAYFNGIYTLLKQIRE